MYLLQCFEIMEGLIISSNFIIGIFCYQLLKSLTRKVYNPKKDGGFEYLCSKRLIKNNKVYVYIFL